MQRFGNGMGYFGVTCLKVDCLVADQDNIVKQLFQSIVEFQDTWIIGGRLTTLEGGRTTGNMIAKWDHMDGRWESIENFGIGAYSYSGDWVNSLLLYHGTLYFGGTINYVNEYPICYYDGSQIREISEKFDGVIRVLHQHRDSMFVGGNFNKVGINDNIKKIAKYNGFSFDTVALDESPKNVYDIVSDFSGIYIVGHGGAANPMVSFSPYL